MCVSISIILYIVIEMNDTLYIYFYILYIFLYLCQCYNLFMYTSLLINLMLIVYTHILYYIYVWIWIYIYIDMASVSGVGGSAGGSGGSDGSGGTGTAAIRGISKTSRGKKKVAKRVVNDPSLMPMPSIGTSGGAIPLYPEVPVEPYTLDEIMDPGCVDCYNRIVIIPEGDGYLPFKSSAKAIAEVIQEKYKKPWLSWGEIKEDKTPQIREVDQFLHCFKTKCTWKREHDAAVLASFDHRFSKRLSSMLAYARNKGEEKRPNWIGENVWTALWRKWNTDAYKQKREKAKTNRASERGTSTHKGGSMSAGEIKYYMVIYYYL
ncbi:uncharacterized protein [Cicer arietinum]|uniref:uncharacterized protein n=1 Tax=Cicer arietinum TaxID=3827 RepID=UPI003CC6412A